MFCQQIASAVLFYRTGAFDVACFARRLFRCDRDDRSAFISVDLAGRHHSAADCSQACLSDHGSLYESSGCGKTTAVNLLLRYYDADDGSITMDGTPVEQFGSTYDCMTVVRQEAVLFHDALRSNLTIYQEMPDSSLLEVLKNVGLDRYTGREMLDSILVGGGANFSGGEKKRICLARALLRETNVLILDEPLENLDDAAANKIEDLLLSIEGKILLIVSHRFGEEKLGMFDRVLKLEKVLANN